MLVACSAIPLSRAVNRPTYLVDRNPPSQRMLSPLPGGEDQGEGEPFSPQALTNLGDKRQCHRLRRGKLALILTFSREEKVWRLDARIGSVVQPRCAHTHHINLFYHCWRNLHSRCFPYFRSFRTN